MKYFSFLITLFLIINIFIGCSDLQDEVTPPLEVAFHGTDIYNPQSQNYHGKLVSTSSNGLNDCQSCHASDYTGGTAKVGCTASNCHPSINLHLNGINDINSDNFHGKFISSNNWDLNSCKQCHINYSGGVASPGCNNTGCHSSQGGPEACNTCHGDISDPTKTAPPKALNNSVETAYRGVGAHENHLISNSLGKSVECTVCHNVPTELYEDGHLDSSPNAEVIFSGMANLNENNPSVYNPNSLECSNTYCHGNFKFAKSNSTFQYIYTADEMIGNNVTVKWNTVDGSQVQCGSCHNLPPTGHLASNINSCFACHGTVVDASGNIINKDKHINGEINVFAN